jgi:osmotically-inducible protein OsmY
MNPSAQLGLAVILLAIATGCDRSSTVRQAPTPPTPPGPAAATWITAKIQAQYFASPDLKPWNIDVTTTSDGHVTLRGEVPDARNREVAVRTARKTEGVTAVDDLLRVPGSVATVSRAGRVKQPPRPEVGNPRERPDLSISTRIQAKFYTDVEVGPGIIDVDTHDGVVTLRGAVVSGAGRRRAVALARNTAGVREVRDALQIDPGPVVDHAGRQRWTANGFDDTGIQTSIESKYFLDPGIKQRVVWVAVANGVVTLRGTVRSDEEKQTAEQIAAETSGVTGVRNELQVRTGGAGGRFAR